MTVFSRYHIFGWRESRRYKEADPQAYFVYVKRSGDAVDVVLSPADFAVRGSHLAVHKTYKLLP